MTERTVRPLGLRHVVQSILVLAAASVPGGCVLVSSVEPLVPDGSTVADRRLLGPWEHTGDHGDVERAMVTFSGPAGYTVTCWFNGGDSLVYAARLGRLGDRWILDVTPGGDAARLGDEWGGMLVLTHTAAEIEFAGDELRVRAPEGDSVRAALRDGRLRLRYLERPKGDVLLTGASGELEAALPGWMSLGGPEWSVWRHPAGWRP